MTNSTTPVQQPGINFLPGAGGAGSAPTPAPIHDIVGPLPFFTGPLWVIVAVVLAVAVAGGVLVVCRSQEGEAPDATRDCAS
jgi:hypothetical protein